MRGGGYEQTCSFATDRWKRTFAIAAVLWTTNYQKRFLSYLILYLARNCHRRVSCLITRSLLRHLLHGPCVCSLLLLVDGDRRPALERAGVHCVRNGHAVLADGDALVLYDKVAFLACWPRAAGALCRTKHMLTALVSSEQCARPRRVVRATWYRLGQGQAKLWKRPDRSETSLLTTTIFRFA